MAKKPGSPDDVMAASEYKPILLRAKGGDPAFAAFAMTKDKDMVLLLDKKIKPKQLRDKLRKDAEAAGIELDRQTLRFGMAEIDTETDDKLVKFVVNKDVSSALRMPMLGRLKPAGYTKVEFTADESLEQDAPAAAPPATEEPTGQTRNPEVLPDEEPATSAPADAPAQPGFDMGPLGQRLAQLVSQIPEVLQTSPGSKDSLELLAGEADRSLRGNDTASATRMVDALQQAIEDYRKNPMTDGAQPAAPETAAPQTGAQPDPALDLGTLAKRLGTLMQAIPGALKKAPDLKANLITLSTAATKQIKDKDAMSASFSIDALEAELARANEQTAGAPSGQAQAAPEAPTAPQTTASTATPAAVPPAAAQTLAKTKMAWTATRGAVEKQLDQLQAKMAEAYDGHGFAADLEKVFRSKVEPILGSFDTSLEEKLDAITSATDGQAQKALIDEAQKIIAKYESYLASEKLIQQLDANPFMPLKLADTLTKTLTVLSKSVAAVAEKVAA